VAFFNLVVKISYLQLDKRHESNLLFKISIFLAFCRVLSDGKQFPLVGTLQEVKGLVNLAFLNPHWGQQKNANR
jgi:hypothetical protein